MFICHEHMYVDVQGSINMCMCICVCVCVCFGYFHVVSWGQDACVSFLCVCRWLLKYADVRSYGMCMCLWMSKGPYVYVYVCVCLCEYPCVRRLIVWKTVQTHSLTILTYRFKFDWITMGFLLYNFGVVGMVSVFWTSSSTFSRSYTVLIGAMVVCVRVRVCSNIDVCHVLAPRCWLIFPSPSQDATLPGASPKREREKE